MNETSTDVAVVGGGIAGLTAAYRLARAGVDFRLLETSPRWGGLIRTETVDGFLLDAGPDTLLGHRPEAVALCRELGLGERLVPASPRPHTTYVAHRRRLHALPEGMNLGVPSRLGGLVSTPLFSWPGKLRMATELARPRRTDGDDESIAGFFRRRLGSEALQRIGDPLLAGIHAGDPERLSVRETFPMLTDMERRHGSLIRALWAARAQPAPRSQFFTLPGGLAELVDTLVSRLPEGARRLQTRVSALRREGGAFRLELGEGQPLTARSLVLATPLWESMRLLVTCVPEAALPLTTMRFASTVTVFLGLRRGDVGHALDGHGLVIARGENLQTRACTFSSSKYPGRAPDGLVLLKGYLGGLRGAHLLDRTDGDLARVFEDEMRGLLGLRGRPVLSRVYRWLASSPQMELGHRDRRARLEAALEAMPGLVITGAGLRGSGIPNQIAEGTRAADVVLAPACA
jgi:oxygen-dependent protoporphyrinogen oxidase